MILTGSSTLHQKEAVRKAREMLRKNPIFLDTETTGLLQSDVVIELAVIDQNGQVIIDSLIKPILPIPADATRIHGITDAMTKDAPFWLEVWKELKNIFTTTPIAAYNAEFDIRMLKQTHTLNKQIWPYEIQSYDIMKVFSEFVGEWNSYHHGFKYFKLEDAGQIMGIPLPNTHRALADARLARELLLKIAAETIS